MLTRIILAKSKYLCASCTTVQCSRQSYFRIAAARSIPTKSWPHQLVVQSPWRQNSVTRRFSSRWWPFAQKDAPNKSPAAAAKNETWPEYTQRIQQQVKEGSEKLPTKEDWQKMITQSGQRIKQWRGQANTVFDKDGWRKAIDTSSVQQSARQSSQRLGQLSTEWRQQTSGSLRPRLNQWRIRSWEALRNVGAQSTAKVQDVTGQALRRVGQFGRQTFKSLTAPLTTGYQRTVAWIERRNVLTRLWWWSLAAIAVYGFSTALPGALVRYGKNWGQKVERGQEED